MAGVKGRLHLVPINISTNGANTLYDLSTAPADELQGRIRVLGYVLVAAGAVTLTFKSNTTALSGAMSLITGVPVVVPNTPRRELPYLQTAKGENLNASLSSGVQVSGHALIEVQVGG